MSKSKIITGIVVLVILGVILLGVHLYKESSLQSEQSSVTVSNPAASSRSYSHADNPNNESGNMGVSDHIGKALNHIGL